MFPKDLKYSKDNTWVKVEGEIATLGLIDDPKVEEFVFVQLPDEGKTIKRDNLPPELQGSPHGGGIPDERPPEITPEKILDALKHAEGNKSRAARLLGIGRRTIYRKLKEYNLTDHI